MSEHRLPPGPRMPAAMQSVGWWARPIAFLERARARFGKTFTVKLLGQSPFVVISDPADLKAVFTADPDVLHPGEGARILEPIVGPTSILLLDGSRHLSQRKLVLPAFHGKKMEALSEVVTEVAEREISSWPEGGQPLHPRMQKLTLAVIMRAVFGLERGERFDRLISVLTEMMEFGTSPLSLLPPFQRDWIPGGSWPRFRAARAAADAEIYGLIAERRAAGDAAEGDDVLSTLLLATHEDGEPMSKEEIRDELLTLLVAGHETTATELAWCFERLVRNPRVLARLVAEIDAGGGDYVTATVRETLRRRPVLPMAQPRKVESPFELGGRVYEPGANLFPSAYLVQHDDGIYPDPYEFRPERFLDQDPGTYTWIPFGGGRRRCIGASFAMLEMDIVLRALLSRSEVRATSRGVELAARRGITVSPSLGAEVALTPRVNAPAAPEPAAVS
ncbi:MAG: cytochrome P450 [Solirubrobacterales bacterium]|nr:cytochrome P450 [Solirubrobacterales bacterium]MCB8971369.1 cytochrome P450 [Thermoleophilales bacterium]MCO5328034.1 cytochrome P450 [Solirubrobacterales bacterium]